MRTRMKNEKTPRRVHDNFAGSWRRQGLLRRFEHRAVSARHGYSARLLVRSSPKSYYTIMLHGATASIDRKKRKAQVILLQYIAAHEGIDGQGAPRHDGLGSREVMPSDSTLEYMTVC